MKRIAAVLFVCQICIGPAGAAAAVWHVGNTTQLVRAIAGANNEALHPGTDTIVLEAGTYSLIAADNDSDGTTGLPSITGSIIIEGNGSIIERADGTPVFRIFHVAPSGDLSLHGMTVRNGYGRMGDSGGGMYNRGRVSMTGCTFSGNGAYGYGGGIANLGIMMMTLCTVSENSSLFGGGIYNTGTLTMTGCTISGNSVGVKPADEGGGIYNNGTLTMTDCTVSDNLVVAGSIGDGGGVSNWSNGRLTMTNCTISDNIVSSADMSRGGGISNRGMVRMSNCTVAGNSATSYEGGPGGGIFVSESGILQIGNSIVASQASGTDCTGPVTSLGYNLDSDGSCGLTATGDLPAGNANLGSLNDNGGPTQTRALLAGSSAIDAADPDGCRDAGGHILARDQRGFVRPVSGAGIARCDMGAYESGSSEASNLYVSGDGVCAGKTPCYATIQEALDAAAYGSAVRVSAGTYHENIQLKPGVVVQGEGAGTATISGTGAGPVVTAENVDSTAGIDGFTITGGNSAAYGGGIYNNSSSPVISNNVIAGNVSSDRGGGILNMQGSSPLILNNTITGNSASGGGGIFNFDNSSPTISGNIITANSAAWCGGGICNFQDCAPEISNNVISGNTASYGGGIGNSQSSPLISNNTISGNSADDAGGIYSGSDSSPAVSNNIIASNTGGGILCFNAASVIDYNDVWNNSPYNVSGCSGGQHDIAADPLFVAAEGGDFRLQPTSPGIDAGDNSAVPSWLITDLYGNPRLLDGAGAGTSIIDMGAAELDPASLWTVTIFASGEGSGAVHVNSAGDECTAFPCYRKFTPGSAVTLSATAGQGSTFAGWRGQCSGTDPCAMSVNSAISVIAAFTLNGQSCATPGMPSAPGPAAGAAGVSVGVVPGWVIPNDAASYDVYLGTSPDPPYAGETACASFAGAVLNYGTTYYWRIVAKNQCGSATSGPVWSFTTAEFCANLPVRIPSGSTAYYYYMSLEAAYEAASDGSVMELQALDYAESLILGRDITVTLDGGHDCAYAADAGRTMISGSLTVASGTAVVGNLLLK